MIPEPTWTPTNHAYHADRSRWSSSMLKVFREDPGLARWRFVDGRPHKDDSPSDAMLIGSAVGIVIAEPENAARDLRIVDVTDRRNKAYKEAFASFSRERVVLTQPMAETVEEIADSVLNPRTDGARLARALLTQGEGYAEWALRWDDPSGVPCRAKYDRLTAVSSVTTVVDTKTAYDVSKRGIIRACRNNGYFEQAAFYVRGFEHVHGVKPEFWFVFVKNNPPYGASAMRLSERNLLSGESQIETDLTKLARALDDERFFAYDHEILEDGGVPVL